MTQSAGPLEIILSDIERALHARLWYVALAVSLSLPDICSLLELPPEDAWSKRWKYAGWFDRNMGRHYRFLTGDDCYSLRGGVVHHGKFGHEKALVYYRMYLERRPDKLRLWRARQQIRLLTGIPSADIPDELVEAKAQLLAIRALLKKHGTNAHPRAFPRPKIAG